MQRHRIRGMGLQDRPVEHRAGFAAKVLILHVADDPDHFSDGFPGIRQGNPFADGILLRPERLRETLVHDHHRP